MHRFLPLLAVALVAAGGFAPALQLSAQTNSGAARSLTVMATPLVVRTPAGERGVVSLTVMGPALTDARVQLSAAGWPAQDPKPLGNLPAGTNRLELEIPVLTAGAAVSARLESPSGGQVFGPFELKPPRKWTIYLTQHTHTDIGYTRPQTEILPEHLRYIDYALDYCDLTDSYPDDARFRWTCETAWAVREYLNRRPADQLERLKRRLQEGRIEVTGMLLNMAEIATESSLAASLQPLRLFREQLGAPIQTAMQDDVNGAAWCLVDYFADAGIKYLTMGINKTRSLLPFDKPTAFWWESPSGKRVLAYRADHYMTANFWRINDGDAEKMQPAVVNYLQSLESRSYPFDRVGVQFSGYYTDNSPPSTVGCDVVKAWNEKYAWPKLRLSTAHEFPEYAAREHGAEMTIHREAWPDWWTDGFGSAARETAAARETEAQMQVNQGLLAMAAILGAPARPGVAERIRQIQEDLLFYAEHTFGAAESIDDPLAENTQVQWGEKGSYAWDAVKHANLLHEEAFGLVQGRLPRGVTPTIAVLNTLNWERSGLMRVFIDHEIVPPDREFRIVDLASGLAVPAQLLSRRAEGAYWALWVSNVPSMGYKIFKVETGSGRRTPEPPLAAGTLTLTNRYYSLVMDRERGGIKSVIDNGTSHELVDSGAPWELGQCIHETLAGRHEMKPDAFQRTSLSHVRLEPGTDGPIWKSLRLTADLDGCATNGVKAEIRLYNTEKRIELHFTLRKLPLNAPEAVYVAFPYRAPKFTLQYEGQGGVVSPGVTQIPGSSSDWQTIQNYLSVLELENGAESVPVAKQVGQIVFCSDQAPLVQLGDLNLGKWQPVTKVEKARVYSWVMNNYWFTNFRANQEGDILWSYALTSSTDNSRTLATRFGWGSRVPFAVRVFPPDKTKAQDAPVSWSGLGTTLPNLLLVEARPAFAGEGVVLHLRELEGRSMTVRADHVTVGREVQRADEVNVLEETIQEGIQELEFKPFASKFVRLLFNP